MDLLSVENFLKLTLYLKERLVLFYWIICFPLSALSGLCIEINALLRITMETDYTHNWAKPSAKRIKFDAICYTIIPYVPVTPGSTWTYQSWGCWWSQLSVEYKLPIDGQKSKIYLSRTGWREMDCDWHWWHFKSKLGSAKQMIRIKQMWMFTPKTRRAGRYYFQ